MWPNPQETVEMATFTEEILNRKLHFLCSDMWEYSRIFYAVNCMKVKKVVKLYSNNVLLLFKIILTLNIIWQRNLLSILKKSWSGKLKKKTGL